MFVHSGFFYKKRVYFFFSLLYNAIMKKLLIIFTLIAIIICSFVTPLSVSADSGDFVLITEKNCKFYLFDHLSYVHKFSIPTTYYVKVLNTQSPLIQTLICVKARLIAVTNTYTTVRRIKFP